MESTHHHSYKACTQNAAALSLGVQVRRGRCCYKGPTTWRRSLSITCEMLLLQKENDLPHDGTLHHLLPYYQSQRALNEALQTISKAERQHRTFPPTAPSNPRATNRFSPYPRRFPKDCRLSCNGWTEDQLVTQVARTLHLPPKENTAPPDTSRWREPF